MDINKIKEIFEIYAKEKGFSGVALMRNEKEDLFSYACGYAHRGFKIPNTLTTRFDTASITKLFTSLGIFLLIDKGLIKLEDKVHDFLDLKDTMISKEVTIFHLLTHTSGIGDDADEEAGESYESLWIDRPNYSIRVECVMRYYPEPNITFSILANVDNCNVWDLAHDVEKHII